jgi:hypothetical protein
MWKLKTSQNRSQLWLQTKNSSKEKHGCQEPASQPAGTRRAKTTGKSQPAGTSRAETTGESHPPATRRVDEWPRPQNREPGGYFPFAVAPVALSKPWGHVLMHNVMTPGKQKLVITDLGLRRAKINSYVAF